MTTFTITKRPPEPSLLKNFAKATIGWLKASRLPSQAYIFVPLLLGQGIAVHAGATFDWSIFVWVQLFGLFDQLYIVYANDVADYDTDQKNHTYTIFSGGSRVLTDGNLGRAALARAAGLMALLSLGCGLVLATSFGRSWAPALVGAALLLLWLYSFPPARLSYRGGGELLQMIGVGAVLPLFGFYAQGGSLASFPWTLLAITLPTNLACSLTTALPDQPSDKESNKRTLAVTVGQSAAQLTIFVLHGLSLTTLWLLGPQLLTQSSLALVTVAPLLALFAQLFFRRGRPGSQQMVTYVACSVLVTVSLLTGLAIAVLTPASS